MRFSGPLLRLVRAAASPGSNGNPVEPAFLPDAWLWANCLSASRAWTIGLYIRYILGIVALRSVRSHLLPDFANIDAHPPASADRDNRDLLWNRFGDVCDSAELELWRQDLLAESS